MVDLKELRGLEFKDGEDPWPIVDGKVDPTELQLRFRGTPNGFICQVSFYVQGADAPDYNGERTPWMVREGFGASPGDARANALHSWGIGHGVAVVSTGMERPLSSGAVSGGGSHPVAQPVQGFPWKKEAVPGLEPAPWPQSGEPAWWGKPTMFLGKKPIRGVNDERYKNKPCSEFTWEEMSLGAIDGGRYKRLLWLVEDPKLMPSEHDDYWSGQLPEKLTRAKGWHKDKIKRAMTTLLYMHKHQDALAQGTPF